MKTTKTLIKFISTYFLIFTFLMTGSFSAEPSVTPSTAASPDSENIYNEVLALTKNIDAFELEEILLNMGAPQDFGSEYKKYSKLDPKRQENLDKNNELKKVLMLQSTQLYSKIQTNLLEFPNDPRVLLSMGILEPLIKHSFPELLEKNGIPNAIEMYRSSVKNLKKSIELKPDLYVAQNELALNYLSSEELQYLIDTEKLSALEVHNEGWKYVKEAIDLLEKGIENAKAELAQETDENKKTIIKEQLSAMMVQLAKQLDWRPEAIADLYIQSNEKPNLTAEELKAKALSLFREAYFLNPESSIAAIYFVTSQLLTHYAQRNGYYVGDYKVLVMPTLEAQKVNWKELIQANNTLLRNKPEYLFEQITVTDLFLYRQAILLEIHDGMAQGQIQQSNIDTILASASEYIDNIHYSSELNDNLKSMSEKYLKDAHGLLNGTIKH